MKSNSLTFPTQRVTCVDFAYVLGCVLFELLDFYKHMAARHIGAGGGRRPHGAPDASLLRIEVGSLIRNFCQALAGLTALILVHPT